MSSICDTVTEHDLLDNEQCLEVAKVIHSLRQNWTLRAGESFFTLGACAYLDAVNGKEAYFEAARITNSVITRSFLSSVGKTTPSYRKFSK